MPTSYRLAASPREPVPGRCQNVGVGLLAPEAPWGRVLGSIDPTIESAAESASGPVHLQTEPAHAARTAPWPAWVGAPVRDACRRQGITDLWAHQARAADLAHAGEHVVIVSGTASGKSLAYLLPSLCAIESARGERGQRGATTVYIAPTKALAHDQAHRLQGFGLDRLRVATHDGDSTPEERAWARDHAEFVLTNPDMLHFSLLPQHERWHHFLARLDYVVIDELHHYRGIFGAHVAHVLRRLRRVCAAHGSSPTFVLASATAADPTRTARLLTGLDVTAVSDDASPRGPRTIALWEPPVVSHSGEQGAPVRRPAPAEAADILATLVLDGARALAFTRSRHGAETVALATRRLVREVDPGLAETIAAYRGGYLPEDRRALEEDLRSGRLRALAATNALELGIDISGLDAVVIAGFPGTRAALWQQFGRAGRGLEPSLGVFVARDDPLDTYLVHHPEMLLGQPVEATVFDPGNPYVLGPHLCAAAAEIPLAAEGPMGPDLFGPGAREAAESLASAGLLRRRAQGWFWTDRRRATDLADLRSTGGAPVTLVEAVSGRVLGTVDRGSAPSSVHTGAVHLHQGDTWVVDDLDLEAGAATLTRDEVDYSTSAREVTDIEIVSVRSSIGLGTGRLHCGTVRVSTQVISYLKRRRTTGEVLGTFPLDLPQQTLQTDAVWWTLPDADWSPLHLDDPGGAAHAAEHASIGLLPLFATCDRWDLGGVSTRMHPDTGLLTVFVYDGHPGGAGFAQRGYECAGEWLRATRNLIRDCPCEGGCPACVQSPKCGNQNHPLDKASAVDLLDLLVGGPGTS
jgi:DEAD/DEAH box helicase domain-containing protein